MWSICTCLEPSSSPKWRRWKLEYVKTCLFKILGTSSTNSGIFASALQERWSKIVPKPSEDSRRDLRMAESVRSYPVAVCSKMHVFRVSGYLNFAPSKFSFPWVSCKMASTTAWYLRTLLFANPSFWSTNSDRTLGFGWMQFEREHFSSRLELRPRRKWPVNWSFALFLKKRDSLFASTGNNTKLIWGKIHADSVNCYNCVSKP